MSFLFLLKILILNSCGPEDWLFFDGDPNLGNDVNGIL